MRKTTFLAAIAAGGLILMSVAGSVSSDKRALEAQASSPIRPAQIDSFQMMLNATNLPSQELEDFSLVFPSPATNGRTQPTP
jgi:hypothetical protein